MTLFDYLYAISLHSMYANTIPEICKSVETIVIIPSVMFFIYKMYLIIFTDTTQDTKKQTDSNDNTWRYEEYNSKPVQKEENTDGKCKPESNTSNADNKH